MMPAAKHFDMVTGVDTHMIQPPGPVPPVPIPHPFVGSVFDPADVRNVNATVTINGMPRAFAGAVGMCQPPHIPIGGAFVSPPTNELELQMGSSMVTMDGDAAAFVGLPVLTCQTVGMPAPPRTNGKKKSKLKGLVLPTSVLLVIPAGLPVTVGGPPTVTTMPPK